MYKQTLTYLSISTAILAQPIQEIKPEMCKNESFCDNHNNVNQPNYNKGIDNYWKNNLPPGISNGIIPYYQ